MERRRLALAALTVQNALHVLLLRHVRSRHVPHMFSASVAVVLTEVVKTVLSLGILAWLSGGLGGGWAHFRSGVLCAPRPEKLRMGLVALVYALQNNLFYVAASHLDGATFILTSQLKILTTALFSRLLLSRRLSAAQWLAILLLTVGVGIVQLPGSPPATSASPWTPTAPSSLSPTASSQTSLPSPSETDRPATHPPESRLRGFLAVVGACVCSGFAGVYFELILKAGRGSEKAPGADEPWALWVRNLQLSLWAMPLSGALVWALEGGEVGSRGVLAGFDWEVWLAVGWYAVGGLVVSLAIRHADNILKNYATSVAVLLATAASVGLFDFRPSTSFGLGAALVLASLWLYNRPKESPARAQIVLPSHSLQMVSKREIIAPVHRA